MFVILDYTYKHLTAEQIDKVVVDKIPDPVNQPDEHAFDTLCMIHVCGQLNPKAPCKDYSKICN